MREKIIKNYVNKRVNEMFLKYNTIDDCVNSLKSTVLKYNNTLNEDNSSEVKKKFIRLHNEECLKAISCLNIIKNILIINPYYSNISIVDLYSIRRDLMV